MSASPADTLKTLSEIAEQAHQAIQARHAHINPVVGLRQGMREGGFPADIITVDCLTSRRRIVLVLHDEHPGVVIHQFLLLDDDGDAPFLQTPLEDFRVDTLVTWMEQHFVHINH